MWMCAICNVDNDYSPPIVEARAMRRSQGWGQLRKFSRLSLSFKYIFVFLLFCLFCSVLLSSDIFNCRLPCSQAGASFNSMKSPKNCKHIKHHQCINNICQQFINISTVSTYQHTHQTYTIQTVKHHLLLQLIHHLGDQAGNYDIETWIRLRTKTKQKCVNHA